MTNTAENSPKRALHCIVGIGQTGTSVVRYYQKLGQDCIVFDDKASTKNLDTFKQAFPDIPVYNTENTDYLQNVSEVVVSPGVPLNHWLVTEAHRQGIPVVGDIEIFARQNYKPVIAITGTNGKSTVTALVGEMAKAAGLKAIVAGNIGQPVLDICDTDFDWVILELSSFQLESTYSLRPLVASILNLSPDHMDRYGSYEEYIAAKQRIYHKAMHAVICADEPLTWPASQESCSIVGFSLGLPSKPHPWGIQTEHEKTYLVFNDENWLNTDELKIKGRHNWLNALAALAIGKCMGLEKAVMCEVLRQFSGLDHRCQWVRCIDEVMWYNDSKGTNVGATVSAVKGLGGAMQGKIVLIAGGQSKGADFSDMREPLNDYVRTLILFGEDAGRIEEAMTGSDVPIVHSDSLDEAVRLAKKHAKPGDAVLLSPACASFDMFDNYAHRGKVFTQLVQNL